MNPVRAALITQNCPAGLFEANLAATLQTIDQAADAGARIIVFPEMNLTGYAARPEIIEMARPVSSELLQALSDAAKKNDAALLIGMAEKRNDNSVYASHIVITSEGYQGIYRKIHTAPFEKAHFTAGTQIPMFEFAGLKFGIQLCYDAHFPEISQAMALKGADVIFIPHASPRGTPLDKYESWLRHLRARAFDNGVYIAACNQVGENLKNLSFPGVSLLIGPDGNVIDKILSDEPCLLNVSIDKTIIEEIRSHRMRYFLPNRRADLFGPCPIPDV